MDRSRVGIVIPAMNEAATIGGVVAAAGRYGLPLIVDDGSSDNTAALAILAGGVVVSHDGNRGYDAALNTGFRKASALGCEIIVTLDADGQHDPTILQKFIGQIDAGADVVVGVRSRRQRLAEHFFAWYTRIRFGIKDPLCGMKAYRVNVFCALGHFDSYESIGTELMMFAARNGYCIGEVPFLILERQGKSRFGRIFSGNYKIFRAMALALWRFE